MRHEEVVEYISGLSTLLLAVEMQFSKRSIQDVCKRLSKTESSITKRLMRGIALNKTPKALIRKLNRQMADEYAINNVDWTEI